MSNDLEIIFETNSGKSNATPISFNKEIVSKIKKEKVDFQIRIKEEKIDVDLEFLEAKTNFNNSDPVPILNEQQIKIKKEKNKVDLDLVSIKSANKKNNPFPVPILNEQQLKIKEENAKRKLCLEGLQKVSTLIESSTFSNTSKKKVKGRKPMKKNEVIANIEKKSRELEKLIPEFKTIFKKEQALKKSIEKLVHTLENDEDEEKLSNFDIFLKEFELLWSSLKKDKENSTKLAKRARTNDHIPTATKQNKEDELDTIKSIKEAYLPLLKKELVKCNSETKNSKKCLSEIQQAKILKNDVWKQFNDLLEWEIFLNSKLEKTSANTDETESDDDDEYEGTSGGVRSRYADEDEIYDDAE